MFFNADRNNRKSSSLEDTQVEDQQNCLAAIVAAGYLQAIHSENGTM